MPPARTRYCSSPPRKGLALSTAPDPTIRVDGRLLEVFCARCLELTGMPLADAAVAANVVVRTSLRGGETHGVRMLPDYLKRLREGAINPVARLSVVRETLATTLLDGDAGLGHLVAVKATELAIQKAKSCGVATVLVRNSNHFGAAGSYALMCAEAGVIGVICTTGPLAIRVTGGRGPGLSSGTRAFGIPNDGPSVVLDISMAPAGTKISMAAERGQAIPLGWLEDSEGRPTTDPAEYRRGGARVPIGDHKGYGMALISELVVGGLSGAANAWSLGQVPAANHPWNLGHSVVVMDVEAFMPMGDFLHRVREITDRVRNSPRAPGTDRILIPGERAAETEAQRLRDGIPLDALAWQRLFEAGSALGAAQLLDEARV